MERLYQGHRGRGFTVLAISIDAGEPGPVAEFVRRLGLSFPIGLDPRMDVAERYKVRALPASFLVDRRGTVAGIALGPRDWDGPAARRALEALLSSPGPAPAARPPAPAAGPPPR